MRGLKIFLLVLSALCVVTGLEVRAAVPDTSALQAYIIDYETGTVLLEKNPHEQMPTSSMSKVMTAYMVFDALDKGAIALDDTFLVSEKAWRMQGSKMFVELGTQIPVQDLLRGLIIQSGNDASIVLAEGLAGTEDSFAAAMSQKAQELGMTRSNFANASGWPDDNHYSTAHDLAMLAKALIRNFPDFYSIYSETEFTWHNIKQGNRNPLLYRNIGADGIKTGHTEAAGYGLIGSAKRDGRRVIMVLNGLPSARARAEESVKLIDWALRSFKNTKLFSQGENVVELKVAFGAKDFVPLTVADDVIVTVPALQLNSVSAEAVFQTPVKAPVQAGTQLGEIVIDAPNMDQQRVPLFAAETVEHPGAFDLFMKRLLHQIKTRLQG